MRQKRRSYRDRDDDEDVLGDELAAVNERLDELTAHIQRMAQTAPGRRTATGEAGEPSADRVADALARLDRRLDQVISEEHAAPPPRPPAAPSRTAPNRIPADWAVQIAARQRVLDGEVSPEAAPTPQPHTPASELPGLEQQLRDIATQIASLKQPRQSGDLAIFKQLEEAVISLQDAMANVASEGALAQLAAEVRGLAAGFERNATEADSDALGRLEGRIAAFMENGRSVPPELDSAVRSLSERLDRMTLSQGDQLALTSLEDRIAKLSKKLDATDARLGHLKAIERGMADLLVHLEEMRGGPHGVRGPPRAEAPAEAAPESPHPAVVAPVASPLDLIPAVPEPEPEIQTPPQPALAALDSPLPPPSLAPPAPAPAAPPVAIEPRSPAKLDTRPRPEPRRPIDPNLPPDTPIEPGSGAPRVRPGSSATARIAASEAALGGARLMPGQASIRSAAIAAARNALKSTYLDSPVKPPRSAVSHPVNLFAWFKKARNAQPALPPPRTAPEPPPPVNRPEPTSDGRIERPQTSGSRILKRLKTLLIAASVGIIVVAAGQTAVDLLLPGDPAELAPPTPLDTAASSEPDAPASSEPDASASSDPDDPANSAPDAPAASEPMRSMPIPGEAPPAAPARPPNPDTTGAIAPKPSFFGPAGAVAPKPASPDATSSIARPPAAPSPTISSALHAAVAAHDPAAEYEMASRYAEGRGVPQDFREAVRLLERAANAGFAPAQFRLAGLNEKGEGLKKNVQAARRLYLAAADKGHAKAMHNLAVLYAEGIDGRPDYRVAAQWFRKAAAYGIADSQYNLAILYARGIGVEANLAESYKWFAIAAAHGDQDAAKKRDEVAARLDPQTLMAAKLAVQTFVVEREPDDATSLRAPPGGWDRAPAQPTKPRPRAPASSAR